MKLIIRSSNGEIREQEITENMNLTPSEGEHYYFTGVEAYTFSLTNDDTTMNVFFMDENGEKINVILHDMANLISQNDPLNPFSQDTIFGVSTNNAGSEAIDKAINNSELESGEIIEALKDALSMDGSTLASGSIVDDFQALLDNMEASAAGWQENIASLTQEQDEENETGQNQTIEQERPASPDEDEEVIEEESNNQRVEENPSESPVSINFEPEEETQRVFTQTELSISGIEAVVEGESATYQVSVTQAPFTDMTIEITISDITTNGDIINEVIQVTIPAGSITSEPFTVENVEDVFKENAEDYSVSITDYSGGGFDQVDYGVSSVVTTITDTIDTTTVAISTSDINEDASSVSFDVQLSNPPQEGTSATVQVEVDGVTYDVAVDANGAGTLTINGLDNSDVYNDSGSYTATVTGVTGGNFEKVEVGQSAVSNVTETIDDTTLILEDIQVEEGSESATIEASLSSAPIDGPLVITLDNGATITFGVGVTTATSTAFTIQEDDIYKDAETYTVKVESYTGGSEFENLITTDTATVEISDTIDTTTVAISTSDINEDATSVSFDVQLSNPPQEGTSATVQVEVGGVTYDVAVDANGAGTLTINGLDNSDVYNDSGSYTATITGVTGGNFEKVEVGQSTTSNITDTIDATTVAISTNDINEDATSVSFDVQLSNPPQEGTNVTVQVEVGGVTYDVAVDSTGAGTLTINGLDNSDVYNDSGSYTATVTGVTGGNFEKVEVGQSAVSNVTETIDDTTLILEDIQVEEGSESATIEASLSSAPIDGPLVITLDNGATITFGVGVTTATSTAFTIQEDDIYKDAETYTVKVESYTGGSEFENLITTDTATVEISDTIDTTTVAISTTDINEDASSVSFDVQLSNPPQEGTSATVQVEVGGVTYDVAVDANGAGTLTINGLDNSDVYNDSGSYTATITGVTGGNFEKVEVGQSTTSNVIDTIDTTTVAISTSDINEDASSVSFDVQLSNPPQEGTSVTVQVEVGGVTYDVAVDSTGAGTLTINGLDNSDVYNDSGSYTATVTGVTGGNFEQVEVGQSTTSNVTETIDDTVLTLENVQVDEGSGTATIEASLTAAPTDEALVITLDNGAIITFEIGETTATSTEFTIQGDDVYRDAQSYSVKVESYTGGDEYENLVTTDTATVKVVDTIDTVTIKVFAADENGTPLEDENGNYLSVNETIEGGATYYVALAFEPNTTEFNESTQLDRQEGTVDFNFSDQNLSAESNDYTPQAGLTSIALGTAVKMDANDDFWNENDENLEVSISNYSHPNTPVYENVSIDTSKVTTTITDNEPDEETPDEGSYGTEDTVYVQLVGNDTVIEGNDLEHTIRLVDANGNPVNLAEGQEIEVTLAYTPSGDNGVEANDYTAQTTVTITGTANGNNEATISNATLDDFVIDGAESYTLSIADINDSANLFENIVDKGDSVTGTITDGVSIGEVENAQVDEDNFVVTNNTSSISDTGSLGISAPSADNAYKLSFTDEPTNSLGEALQSDGQDITYNVDGDTITATREDGATVFEINLDKNGAGGSNDSYTYTQFKNIDHPISGDASDTANDDDITLNFGFNITDGDAISPEVNFEVTVSDSLPEAIDDTFTINEDSSKIITLTEEGFGGEISELQVNNGTGFVTLDENNPTIDILDPNDSNVVAGQLTFNEAGYVKFTPTADYSNYNDTPSFTYQITDSDGDSATGTIELDITPVADGLNWNYSNVTTMEDTTVDLNLQLPSIKDNSDDNLAATGDHSERVGAIELNSIDKGAIIHNDGVDLNDGSNTTNLKIVIVDENGNLDTSFHHSDINMDDSSIIHLTQSEFENLTITPAPESHNDITMQLKATSYEVSDNGSPLDGVAGKTDYQNVKVVVKSVTDEIDIEFDNAENGTISSTDSANDTFTHDTLTEGGNIINLNAILNKTSGTQADATPDLDGSEQRSYTVSNIPEGTVITLGGISAVAGANEMATVHFNNTSERTDDPEFTMELPEQYSGEVNAEITLKVRDVDDHAGSDAPETLSDTVYFNVNVIPEADQVTLNVSQARGLEDAGRDEGNSDNDSSADDINAKVGNEIPGAIDLDVNVYSDDTDGSETFTVIISDIPNEAILYYNGEAINLNGEDTQSSITIENFESTTPLQIVPPHNSDEDFDLKVKAYTVDTAVDSDGNVTTVTSEQIAQELTMNVQVKGVADIPTNNELNEIVAENGNTYQAVVTEDMGNTENGATISLLDVYQNTELSSYDNDSSEALTVVITGLESGTSVDGAIYIGGEGESRRWVVDSDDVENVEITTPKNFSGELDFQIGYVTTEREGDSATHDFEDVKVLVQADAEATMVDSTSVLEDTLTTINFNIASNDGDSDESIESVKINVDDVSNKDFTLYVDGNEISSADIATEDGYYVIENDLLDKVQVQYDADVGSSNDTSFDVKYIVKDSAAGIDDLEERSDTYNLNLNAVTDEIDLDIENENISIDANSVIDLQLSVTAQDQVENTGEKNSIDDDGSETVTHVIIEGVPEGMNVVGGTYLGDLADGSRSGMWVKEVDENFTENNNGIVEPAIQLAVDGTSDMIPQTTSITMTAYNQDGSASSTHATTSMEITKDKNFDDSAAVTGTDPLSADLSVKDFDVVEDTSFTLADVIEVSNVEAGTDNNFSITIEGLENCSVSGASAYTMEGESVYVITGSGTDIESALSNVTITPDANYNLEDGGNLELQATLTTYAPGGQYEHDSVSIVEDVASVTDNMDISASDLDGSALESINEDGSQTFKLNLSTVDDSNSDDGLGYTLENGTIELTHNGVSGTINYGQGDITVDGNTIDVPVDKVDSITFTPDTNLSGTATFDYSVTHTEDGAQTSQVSTGSFSLDVTAVADGLELDGLNASGDEYTDGNGDRLIELKTDNGSIGDTTMIDTDGSEQVQTIIVDNVPDGFLVFTGEEGSQTLAQNGGDNGSSETFNLSGSEVNYNTWNIGVESDGTSPQIWIQAPEDWSGTVESMELKTVVNDGGSVSVTSTSFDLDVNPVASEITISPTQTFEDAYDWTEINLNANMTDLDGSETINVTLSGQDTALDSTATFRLSDGTIMNGEDGAPNASFDENDATWTLEDIPSDQINNIEMLYHDYSGEIDVSVVTVDGDDVLDTPVTGSFDMNISGAETIDLSDESEDITIETSSETKEVVAGSGDDTITYEDTLDSIDGGDGHDTLLLHDEDGGIDFTDIAQKADNIEEIDLENGASQKLTMELDDLVDVTSEENHDLVIKGDDGDVINLHEDTDNDNKNDWQKEDVSDKDGYDQYTNTTEANVNVYVDQDIDVNLDPF